MLVAAGKSVWRSLLFWMLKADAVVLAVDLSVFGVFMTLGFNAVDLAAGRFFSITLLLGCGIAFLVGGAMAFTAGIFSAKVKEQITHQDEPWSVEKLKKGEQKAHPFLVLAVVLFVESLLLSLFGL